MDKLEDIFRLESETLVRELAEKLCSGRGFGSFSTSIYDTAWLARVRTTGSDSKWLFPQCFEYLLDAQEPNGGWLVHASEIDGILNTMAALIALKEHHAQLNGSVDINADELERRITLSQDHLRVNLQTWDVSSTVHVGFEVLVPALLEELERQGVYFDFEGRQTLMLMNQHKLRKFRPEILYSQHKTTLVHSLEAFVGKIDFDRVSHHVDQHGSMMASPAATAAYLMCHSTWDNASEAYLKNVVAYGSGLGSGGVPGAFPSSNFEVTWIISTLLKAQNTPALLNLDETGKIRAFILSQFESHGEVLGWDSGLLEDADDTAKAIVSLNLLGVPTSPKRLVEEFEAAEHFRTYRLEQNWSFSANCNVLDALLHCNDPESYRDQITKVSKLLCAVFNSGQIRDKWNLSDGYSTMLLCQALVKLVQVWDSNGLRELPSDLIREQIPIVLLQNLLHILHRQSPDGSWRLGTVIMETTAYAVLTLKVLALLPWHDRLRKRVLEAVRLGSAFLVLNYDSENQHEHIWVAKVTYALPPIARAYVIAALTAGTTYTWYDKGKNLMVVPDQNLRKMAKFFSALPMFSQDELWALESDVFLGYLYQPMLLRANPGVFPWQKMTESKYAEYIPFTWIAMNRRNNYPLSNNILWEMMKMSALIYQLDEFMETLSTRNTDLANLTYVRQLVRQLCEFGRHDERKLDEKIPAPRNPSTGVMEARNAENGHGVNGVVESCRLDTKSSQDITLVQVQTSLQHFTSYILQHPAVVQSPDSVRKQLHSELCTGILAHIDHEEDNARYAAQRRLQSASESVLPAETVCYASARSSYHSWVRTTSADNTQAPSTFTFFSCLAAPPGKSFFRGVRQHYVSSALSRHLANLCRQYNDYGSVARDRAEGNLNSIDFVEFHEIYDRKVDNGVGNGTGAPTRDVDAMKADLISIAQYERECLDHAIGKLDTELRCEQDGRRKMETLSVFIDTTDLYGQIYVARDISNRLR